jgi:amino acid transporter
MRTKDDIEVMAQESTAQETVNGAHGDEHANTKGMLGPILCWAVVFADIGTSIYYVPGILYQTVGSLAGFFVFLTMSVFVLLSLKYAEVTHRFPQGGGVVTVAAQAINSWFGALGGMFILVDYFLTTAISCLSGMQYLSVVIPAMGPYALWITIVILALLGLLNWVGVSESARVSLVGAVIAFVSDLAILFTVFTHVSFTKFLGLFHQMFVGHVLTPASLLIGFAGSFLAFSGLESISQLSPVMKQPHKKVAGIALLFVVLTIGLTSPLLTMFSTLLQPQAASNAVLSAQLISLLGGHWGNIVLQTEVAISASALLVFASNTAIIGAYHVFIALSRMGFLPEIVLKRNKLRGTPHFSIALATGIPVIILIVVAGNINILGDMYAFGLLGAFTLTCLGLDLVRYREWKKVRAAQAQVLPGPVVNSNERVVSNGSNAPGRVGASEYLPADRPSLNEDMRGNAYESERHGLWFKIEFFLGVLTTLLVIIAWSTNLITKPLATGFGGGVTALGMLIAYVNFRVQGKLGQVPVPVVVRRIEGRMPEAVLAILSAWNGQNDAVIQAAVHTAEEAQTVAKEQRPVVFLYFSEPVARETPPQMLEIVDPYLDDEQARQCFSKAEGMALKAKIPNRQYVYLRGGPDIVTQVWQLIHPHDMVIPSKENELFKDINPDRIRFELTSDGKVVHLLKNWQ